MSLRFLLFATLITIFSCNSEVNVAAEDSEKITAKPEWPKAQDPVEDLFKHYEDYIQNLEYVEGHMAVQKNGKWGVVDQHNQLFFDFLYDTIVSNASSIALKLDGKYMIYDALRQEVAEIKAQSVEPVMSNFYAVSRNGKKALLNPNGLLILDHRFSQISGPRDESYFLGELDEAWKAYDMAGNELAEGKGVEASRWKNEYKVGLKSYGPLKIGMSLAELEKALGWSLNKSYGDEYCAVYDLGDDFLQVSLMVNTQVESEMSLERIYIFESGVGTKSGIKIGSTAKDVRETYGSKIMVESNKYDENTKDLLYVPKDRRDRNFRLNFLSKSGVVQHYSLGRLPSILFVEGCL